jgi:TRAP transporter 4TM/12TM fusion protein
VRKLAGYAGLVVATVAVAMSVYHVYARLTIYAPDQHALLFITLGFSLVLSFLLWPARKDATPDRVPWSDLGLAALSLACVGYMFVNYEYIVNRFPTAHPLSATDMAVGAVGMLLVLEATRRTIGMSLPIVAIVFLVYALGGNWMLGFLHHRGLTAEITIDQSWFTTEGVFGVPLQVAGTYVILFIIFGTFLERSGAGQFFMNFANAIAGGARGGPGKVAVVSSSLFGTISGSAVANVMVDGWLTIPMMKKTGFKPEAAAAIEAVASTGGQIMPPIMGAAAFVMAEFLGASYTEVMVAAAIPAVFYYGALFAAIHFNAVRSGLKGLPREELPVLRYIMIKQAHLFLPVVVLLALLLMGFTPTYGAIIATGALVVISWLRPATGLGARACLEALRDGAVHTVPVAMACASAGIVIGIVLQTGLALRFTAFLVDLTYGYLVLALLITMMASIILGMGMPTTPAYIMQAALLVPAIIKLGVEPMAAHMFAFYFSCLSAVTPPVALAVYAAASIGGASLWG